MPPTTFYNMHVRESQRSNLLQGYVNESKSEKGFHLNLVVSALMFLFMCGSEVEKTSPNIRMNMHISSAMCSCVGEWKPAHISQYTFSSNFNCVVCLILASVFCCKSYIHCVSCPGLHWSYCECCGPMHSYSVDWVKISKKCLVDRVAQ